MPATGRKRLKGHRKRSEERHGSQHIVLGLVILVAASALLLVAALGPGWGLEIPREVPGVFGGFFAFAGVLMTCRGVKGHRRDSQMRSLSRLRPDEPWLRDYLWDETQTGDDKRNQAFSSLLGAFLVAAFVVPFCLVGAWAVVLPLFGSTSLIFLAAGIYYLVQHWKYGDSYLRYESFPFFLGQELEAHFGCTKDLGPFERVTATLRCIEERQEPMRQNQLTTVCYELHQDALEIQGPGELRAINPDLGVIFSLPDDRAAETCLSGMPCRYWELEIRARTPGVDYGGTFLVPVYVKPG